MSAFTKAGVYPLNKNAVPSEKLMPCESFRDSNSLQKLQAVWAGKQAVEEYLRAKTEAPTPITCRCQKKISANTKPKPGGKLITSDAYIEEVEMYDAKKNVNAVTSQSQMICKSPRLSITGIQKFQANIVSEDSDTESDTYESEKCCVCGQFSPTNLDTKPHIKIVNWGQWDECGHWVHLSFCHTKSVLRRGDSFPCPHCC